MPAWPAATWTAPRQRRPGLRPASCCVPPKILNSSISALAVTLNSRMHALPIELDLQRHLLGMTKMANVAIVAGVVVAVGTIVTGLKCVGTYIYKRGFEAGQEAVSKAKLEADIEALKRLLDKE